MSPNDPTPAEIAAACFEIQSGWSDEERLRADWRPMVSCADGRVVAFWQPDGPSEPKADQRPA